MQCFAETRKLRSGLLRMVKRISQIEERVPYDQLVAMASETMPDKHGMVVVELL